MPMWDMAFISGNHFPVASRPFPACRLKMAYFLIRQHDSRAWDTPLSTIMPEAHQILFLPRRGS
jgi:hypothetical protein